MLKISFFLKRWGKQFSIDKVFMIFWMKVFLSFQYCHENWASSQNCVCFASVYRFTKVGKCVDHKKVEILVVHFSFIVKRYNNKHMIQPFSETHYKIGILFKVFSLIFYIFCFRAKKQKNFFTSLEQVEILIVELTLNLVFLISRYKLLFVRSLHILNCNCLVF